METIHSISRKFAIGDRVVKIVGERLEGKVVSPFSVVHYRQPIGRVVFVSWEDGSRGWIDDSAVVLAQE
jgi:hypothetical protein